MTSKEIASAVGADVRTVQRWVKIVGDKMSSVNDKMSSSSPTYPADYDLDEAVAIISEGLGENAGHIFRMNAEQSKPKKTGKAILSGALMSGMISAHDRGLLSRDDFRALLGLTDTSKLPTAPNGQALNLEVARLAASLTDLAMDKVARAGASAGRAVAIKEANKANQARLNYRLPLGGHN
jgi:hypothetical protein